MGIFVRAVVLFVGLFNAWVFVSVGGDPVRIAEDPGTLAEGARLSLLPVLLVAMVAGLLTSELLLRGLRTYLEGKFLSRSAAMVLAMWLGGTLFGALLPLAQLLGSQVSILGLTVNVADSLSELIYFSLITSIFGGVIGGMVGAFEGLILALPLAAVLGRFRNGD